jgi:hypothetical protein
MDMQVVVNTRHDTVLQRDVQVVNISCTFTDPNADTVIYDTNFVENLTLMTRDVIASVYDATVIVMNNGLSEASEEQSTYTKEQIQERLGPMKKMIHSTTPCDCLICHDPINTKQFYRTLPCEHKYHKKCIDKWIFKNPTCPTCRKNIFEP